MSARLPRLEITRSISLGGDAGLSSVESAELVLRRPDGRGQLTVSVYLGEVRLPWATQLRRLGYDTGMIAQAERLVLAAGEEA
ncbi:hypothetical protein [Ancylobacter oerskovii]|uniref:Uncharacterized protein n=1 Tax=Ancylobacter oerskovii TaxID=459519 RepID=A0ABW4Z479_9HYPH|nr:hypothetical protein [Ancylobacter oerskovii]MBS7545717.1 hypothetical protein [Ancylobacter oerskovii]